MFIRDFSFFYSPTVENGITPRWGLTPTWTDSIDESLWGTPYVKLKADDWGLTSVDCYFSKDDASLLASLSSGQSIVIKGTCDDYVFANVEVDDCSIVG